MDSYHMPVYLIFTELLVPVNILQDSQSARVIEFTLPNARLCEKNAQNTQAYLILVKNSS